MHNQKLPPKADPGSYGYPCMPPVPAKKNKGRTVVLLIALVVLLLCAAALFVLFVLPVLTGDEIVSFGNVEYQLTVATSNPQYGTVEGSGVYDKNRSVTIRAIAEDGCLFYQWSDGSTEPTRTIKIRDDSTYTAIFYGPLQLSTTRDVPPDAKVEGEEILYEVLLDRITTTDSSAPDGYVLASTEESVQPTNLQYVQQWPSGFAKEHPLYQLYNLRPATVSGERQIGYIYWHWCHGDYTDGPINRTTGLVQDGSHDTFHAYYSTEAPDVSGDLIYDERWIVNPTPDGTYHHPNGCCSDTYWFYVLPVMECTGTYAEDVFVYERWSEPVEDKPSSGEYRTFTAYQYRVK